MVAIFAEAVLASVMCIHFHDSGGALDVTCDKGPILEQLLDSVGELKSDQKRMVNALVDIAKHQERLVALADRTSENKRDIDTLYQLQREGEAHLINTTRELDLRITNHLVHHPTPEACKGIKVLSTNSDGKFDKIQVAVVLTMIYFLSNQVWGLLQSLVQAAQRVAGG